MEEKQLLKDALNLLNKIKDEENQIKYKKDIEKIKDCCTKLLKQPNSNPGKYNPRNKLNDLTGKEWIRFTKSWFIHNPPPRSKNEFLHPAKFPEDMIEDFIKYFTKKEQKVLDPFMGTGSTIVACENTNRIGYGVEITEKYFNIAYDRVNRLGSKNGMILGDCQNIDKIWDKEGLEPVDFIITSPPYWNMLKESRGNVVSAQKKRLEIGLDTYYSDNPYDLGNIDDYDLFVEALGSIFDKLTGILKRDKYLVVILQNMRVSNGEMKTLAWDVTKRLSQSYVFVGEKLWLQDNKQLGIWGYPSSFVSNVHHQYCLIFKNSLLK